MHFILKQVSDIRGMSPARQWHDPRIFSRNSVGKDPSQAFVCNSELKLNYNLSSEWAPDDWILFAFVPLACS
jgi:hypothetical protein